MARTPLMGTVQRAVAEVAEDEGRSTRRGFLRDAAAAGAATTAFGVLAGRARAATPAGKVVVVGAGLAGLTAAHRLKRAGVLAELHEASTRIGGRCWSIRGVFADDQIAEHGGELIDQGHMHLRQLASELGLTLDNLLRGEANGTEQTNWFDGARYSYEEATDDIKAAWQKIHSDASAASYPTTFDSFTERGRQLDRMSIVDWINESVEGGIKSKLGQLLDVAYNIEYGAESSDQSSLNLLYLLAYSGQGQLRIFGPSNEKYHVVGGNDQIPARMAAALQGQITLGSELVSIARNKDATYHVRGGNDQVPDRLAQALAGQITTGSQLVAIRVTASGRWELTFEQGSSTNTVTADRVVLALPFSIMRTSVDFSRAPVSSA